VGEVFLPLLIYVKQTNMNEWMKKRNRKKEKQKQKRKKFDLDFRYQEKKNKERVGEVFLPLLIYVKRTNMNEWKKDKHKKEKN